MYSSHCMCIVCIAFAVCIVCTRCMVCTVCMSGTVRTVRAMCVVLSVCVVCMVFTGYSVCIVCTVRTVFAVCAVSIVCVTECNVFTVCGVCVMYQRLGAESDQEIVSFRFFAPAFMWFVWLVVFDLKRSCPLAPFCLWLRRAFPFPVRASSDSPLSFVNRSARSEIVNSKRHRCGVEGTPK